MGTVCRSLGSVFDTRSSNDVNSLLENVNRSGECLSFVGFFSGVFEVSTSGMSKKLAQLIGERAVCPIEFMIRSKESLMPSKSVAGADPSGNSAR